MQSRGIFWLEGTAVATGVTLDTDYPLQYEFSHNQFNYTFSRQGAIYSHDIDTETYPTYMLFRNNEYNHVYSLDSAIMKAVVSGSSSEDTYAVHNFTDERLFEVQNGAFGYTGKN